MAVNAVRLAALAERLIRENGRAATLITDTNTGTDFKPVITPSSQNIMLVESQFNADDKNDFLIEARDVKFLISSSYEPTTQKRIGDDGQQYSIVAVKKIKPGATVCLYIVQGRV